MSALLNLGDKITAGNRADATFFYKKRVLADSGTLLTEAETDANNRELLAQSLFDKASIVNTAGGVKASKAYSVKGTDFTVTRAGVKNVVNRAGVLTEVASNTPATEFANGVLKGTLIEPARTNVFVTSENATTFLRGEGVTITVNTGNGADGTLTADNISGATDFAWSSSSSNLTRAVNVTAGLERTFSCWIRSKGATQVRIGLRDNSVTGSIISTLFNLTEGVLVRLSRTQSTNLNAQTGIIVGNADGDFEIWGMQLETGSVATSYIKTVDTAITQPADVITATGVSGLIGQTSGGFVAKVNARNFGTGRTIAVIGTIENGIHIFQTGLTVTALFRSADTDRATLTGTFVAGANAVAVRYDGTAVALHVNGAEAQTGTATSWSPGVMSSYYFGCDSADLNQYNDIITDADLYTTALTQAQANTRTTL
jgi:hypothetical protein